MTTDDAEREFSMFVRFYSARLLAVAFRYADNRLIAEDILQEAFAKMWKAWPTKPDQDGPLTGWAYTIVARTGIDHYRSVKRRKTGKDEIPVRDVPWDREKGEQIPGMHDVAEEAIFRAMSSELWAAVATLEEVQQHLIHLIYVDQWSLNRARKELGLAGTTATRFHKAAVDRLREIIGGDEYKEAPDGGR